ncbi:response regulator [Caldinitratiruptor microaerophilus]|uniref:Stage 0 sporulation protein A homolog n=1 Tax=Caldinitratiruptor microaerophilus TaxID=671077 RepID=A0AA35G8E7_9FIRM|nr:response regulator transcription factor [Caldinitratiruptor microaerophilus]BDG60996.1 DNA-binding response regulator [Caldinitratiruptor microaerophilus]
MEPIRVLLVDDHAIFRRGTADALRLLGGLEVVGEAGTAREAVERARTLRPDVVLMDLSLPDESGLEATRRIVREVPEARVVVLTYLDDEASLLAALRAGARGYLLKTVAPEELWAHVRAAAAGAMPISGSITLKLFTSLEERHLLPGEGDAVPLTPRERELVTLVAQGYSNREIARRLFLSVSTVKLHLRNVLRKLNLRNRTELVAHAARTGLWRGT